MAITKEGRRKKGELTLTEHLLWARTVTGLPLCRDWEAYELHCLGDEIDGLRS